MTAIAGHLLGDILLQNRWIARVKQERWYGMVIHCVIVTAAVTVLTGWWDYRATLVFVTHLLIDQFALGKKWWPKLLNQGDPTSDDPAPMWLRLMDDQSLHIVSLALIGML